MCLVLLPELRPFTPKRATTQTLWFTRNVTSLLPVLMTSLQTSTNCTKSWSSIHITDAHHCYQHLADSQHSLALEFKIGSQAFIKAQFFHMTGPTKKLSEKFLGLYKIIAQPGSHSVTLRLPDSLCTVHLVFHVSMLEPAILNTIPDQVQPPPHQLWLTTNLGLRSWKSWTPRSIIAVVPANYCTSSVGQVMKAPMKKLYAYLLLS